MPNYSKLIKKIQPTLPAKIVKEADEISHFASPTLSSKLSQAEKEAIEAEFSRLNPEDLATKAASSAESSAVDPRLLPLLAAGGAGGLALMGSGGNEQNQVIPPEVPAPIIPPVQEESRAKKVMGLLKPVKKEAPKASPAPAAETVTPKGPSAEELTDQEMKAAIDRRNENQLLANLMEAGSQIGAGIGGIQYVPGQISKNVREIAEQPVKDIELQRKNKAASMEFQLQKQTNDPNSQLAAMYKEVYKQVFGKDLPPGVTPAQLKASGFDLDALVGKKFQADALKEARKETARVRAEAGEERKHQKVEDFIQKNRDKVSKLKNLESVSLMSGAMNEIDRYLKNPDPVTSSSLAYTFAKINDPQTGVRDHELKLLGASGSAFDRVKQSISQFANGEITPDKARQFKEMMSAKFVNSKQELIKDLEGIKTQSDRIGADFKDIIGNTRYNDLYGAGAPKQAEQQKAPGKTVVKKGYNPKTNQTQFIYSDGTKEIVEGRR